MNTADPLAPEIPRDRWGRPLVIPLDGDSSSPLIPLTRCTTYVGALEDTYKLGQWQMRMTAIGLAARPDLVLSTVAHTEDKAALDEICQKAIEAAKAGAAAITGTALHALTEQLDRGTLDIDTVPEAYRADLRAYREGTAGFRVLDIETFMVHDGLRIGGTPDRRVAVAGTPYILDIKTGSIEYGTGKIAMQLAVYSRCRAYDPRTGARSDVTVDQDRAIIAHLPAGTGRLDLHWVDIAAGWEAVRLAGEVREWRRRKGLTRLLDPSADPILEQIAAARTPYDLRLLWAHNQANGWTEAHTAAARTRKAELLNDTQGALL